MLIRSDPSYHNLTNLKAATHSDRIRIDRDVKQNQNCILNIHTAVFSDQFQFYLFIFCSGESGKET